MKKPLLNTLGTLIVLFAFLLSCQGQSKVSNSSQKIEIQLVAKYKNNELFDISSDGKLLLLFGASTPTKDLKSQGLIEWRPKRGEEYFYTLRVVEWESGRELGRISIEYVPSPSVARFVEGTKRVCFREYEKGKENKLWDYVSRRVSVCADIPTPEQGVYRRGLFQKHDSPNSKYIAEASVKKERRFLLLPFMRGVITIYDRSTGEKLGVALHPPVRKHPDNPGAGYFYGFALSPDNKYLITYYEFDTYIWRLNTPDKR